MSSHRLKQNYWKYLLSSRSLDGLALGAWGVLLLKLWLSEQLYLLIHPNYIWLTVVAGFSLLLISGLTLGRSLRRALWRSARQHYAPMDGHRTLMPTGWSSALLLGAAILGLLVGPRPFASDTALQRGVSDTLGATRAVPKSFRASNRPEERSLIEWVRTLDVYPEPDAYVGQKVKVQGFVVHPQNLPDNFMLITRFVITCCAADVYPVSLPVKLTQSRASYPRDKWLEIEGQMIAELQNNKRQLAIQPTRLTPIPEPKNPYDY